MLLGIGEQLLRLRRRVGDQLLGDFGRIGLQGLDLLLDARAHPLGTTLKVHANADTVVTGRFDGLEPDGALRLRRDDGSLELVRAGDVEL